MNSQVVFRSIVLRLVLIVQGFSQDKKMTSSFRNNGKRRRKESRQIGERPPGFFRKNILLMSFPS